VQSNKAVQNTVEQNKVGGEVIMGEYILRRRGRLYYDRRETLLRSRGDILMGETISRDTGIHAWWPIYRIFVNLASSSFSSVNNYIGDVFEEFLL